MRRCTTFSQQPFCRAADANGAEHECRVGESRFGVQQGRHEGKENTQSEQAPMHVELHLGLRGAGKPGHDLAHLPQADSRLSVIRSRRRLNFLHFGKILPSYTLHFR